jgi:imidazolonepropionase-like amidohydrolase
MNIQSSNQMLLNNARLFAGVDAELIEDAAIWIDGRTVRYAGPATDLPEVPEDVTRIDLGGQFVMPGMTESHAHLS